MSVARCQITLQGRTGIAEDQFVNTIYLQQITAYDALDFVGITNQVRSFYNDPVVGGGVRPLADYISAFVLNQATIRFYDMAAAEPRTPTVETFNVNVSSLVQDLPEEVAICASFHGSPPVTNRRRGRIYLGPFQTLAVGDDPSVPGYGPSRPATALLQCIRGGMERLKDGFDALGYTWVIRSTRPAQNYVDVEGGWVDDAWDTQRRRGVDPSTRFRWPVSPA